MKGFARSLRRTVVPVLAVAFVWCGQIRADRFLIAPQFYWADWYQYIPTPPGGPPVAGTHRCIDVSLTNTSKTVEQKVKTTFTTVPASFSTSTFPAGPVLPMGIFSTSTPYVPLTPGSPQTMEGTSILPPSGTALLFFCAVYNNQSPCPLGDWHLKGAFKISFLVTEDRGAILAVLDSRMENAGCGIATDNVISALRNAARTVAVNGGRPF
jgi:hypothetical protein